MDGPKQECLMDAQTWITKELDHFNRFLMNLSRAQRIKMAEDSIQVFVFPPLADPHNPCAARPLKKHWGGPPGHEV
ncbi:MAG: hypothetical protein NZ744_04705, partial [Pirellulaceae bacterium]|nr:hypothetical protein [Pirellulaceae bacterium]